MFSCCNFHFVLLVTGGRYGPLYETSVVKFLHLCFHAVIFIFLVLVTGGPYGICGQISALCFHAVIFMFYF